MAIQQIQHDVQKCIYEQSFTQSLQISTKATLLAIKGFFSLAMFFIVSSLLAINKFLLISKLMCLGYFISFLLSNGIIISLLYWYYQNKQYMEYSVSEIMNDYLSNDTTDFQKEQIAHDKSSSEKKTEKAFSLAIIFSVSTFVFFSICVVISIFAL